MIDIVTLIRKKNVGEIVKHYENRIYQFESEIHRLEEYIAELEWKIFKNEIGGN